MFQKLDKLSIILFSFNTLKLSIYKKKKKFNDFFPLLVWKLPSLGNTELRIIQIHNNYKYSYVLELLNVDRQIVILTLMQS